MKSINQIKIFVSCPSDIVDELTSIRLIVEEINKTSGKHNSYNLEILNWKTDTYTQVGSDAQEVINDQLEGEWDILVGLLWLKIGTPTKRDKSGTIEEINRTILIKEKELLVYFKTAPPDDIDKIDLIQLGQVRDFRVELSSKGVLYKEFNSIEQFESLFRINLTNLIIEKILNQKTPQESLVPLKAISDKYSSINELISEVENNDGKLMEIDVFKLVEETTSSLRNVTTSLHSITDSLNELTNSLKERITNINSYLHIKDDRLRMSKIKVVTDLLSNDLDEFNKLINLELPVFSKNFTSLGYTYPTVMLVASSLDSSDAMGIKQSALEYKDSMDFATVSCADLLREVMKWPVVNSKFNKSKRDTEITLKNLIKEFLNGLYLLNEATENLSS